MKVQFTFENLKGTDAIKQYAEKKVQKFDKYINYPVEIHFILSMVERKFQKAEITCRAEHHDLVAVAKTRDLYESIDSVVAKVESQLKKEREKKKGHTAAHRSARVKPEKLPQELRTTFPHMGKKKRNAETVD